jgi:hypothetical protein
MEEPMRRIVSMSVLAVGLIAVTNAQEPARPGGDAPSTAKAIVVTGCVTGNAGSLMLTNAMAANSTARPGASAVGTSGIASSYELSARAGLDLSSHVGHKVEITGTPVGIASGPGSPGASTIDRTTAGSSGAATDRASDRPEAGAAGAASDRSRAGASGETTNRAADRAGAGGVGGAGSVAGGSPSGRPAAAQKLNVTALKMVSTTCP